MAFSWLDLLVVVIYLLAITAFGAHFGKSQRTLHDYFLGGRRLPWWAIAFSVVSAETSVLTIISTPGIAYISNLGFLQLVFGYLVARVVISFLLIPRYFAGNLFTAYQLIENRTTTSRCATSRKYSAHRRTPRESCRSCSPPSPRCR